MWHLLYAALLRRSHCPLRSVRLTVCPYHAKRYLESWLSDTTFKLIVEIIPVRSNRSGSWTRFRWSTPFTGTNTIFVTTRVLSSSKCTNTRSPPGLRYEPRWELSTLPGFPSRLGRGHPFLIPSPRRLWRLDLAAYGASLLDAVGFPIFEPTAPCFTPDLDPHFKILDPPLSNWHSKFEVKRSKLKVTGSGSREGRISWRTLGLHFIVYAVNNSRAFACTVVVSHVDEFFEN